MQIGANGRRRRSAAPASSRPGLHDDLRGDRGRLGNARDPADRTKPRGDRRSRRVAASAASSPWHAKKRAYSSGSSSIATGRKTRGRRRHVLRTIRYLCLRIGPLGARTLSGSISIRTQLGIAVTSNVATPTPTTCARFYAPKTFTWSSPEFRSTRSANFRLPSARCAVELHQFSAALLFRLMSQSMSE